MNWTKNETQENCCGSDAQLRLEVLSLATSVVGAKDPRNDTEQAAEIVRTAKRFWKFVKNDPLADKQASEA